MLDSDLARLYGVSLVWRLDGGLESGGKAEREPLCLSSLCSLRFPSRHCDTLRCRNCEELIYFWVNLQSRI